jgi:uncharacterized LabA/DUF88 family protein
MKKKESTVYAFIDSQNLNLGIRDQGWKLDFARFRVYLKDKFKVKRAFLFIGYVKGNEKLYAYLKKAGYILIFKSIMKIKREKETLIKGNVDAELVLHTMIEYSKYDQAVIVTGDGDFYCLVEYLVRKNKIGKLIIPNRHKYSSLFLSFKKYMVLIDKQYRKRLEITEKRK